MAGSKSTNKKGRAFKIPKKGLLGKPGFTVKSTAAWRLREIEVYDKSLEKPEDDSIVTVNKRLMTSKSDHTATFNLQSSKDKADALNKKKLLHRLQPTASPMQAALQNSQNGSTEVVMHGQNIRLPTFIIASRAASQAAEAAANADTSDDPDYEDDSYADLQQDHPIFSQHRVADDPAAQNLHASLDAADLSIDEATPYQHPPADTVEGDQHADEFETETAFVELLRINKVTADWEALLKCNRLYLPSAALGRIQEFTNQVIDTLTLEEKRGQFVLLLQAMGNAARAHTDHATHVPKQANSKGIIAYSDELTRLIRLEKAAWSNLGDLVYNSVKRAQLLANASQINHFNQRRDTEIVAAAARSANIASKATVRKTNKWAGSSKPETYDIKSPIVEWLNQHTPGLQAQFDDANQVTEFTGFMPKEFTNDIIVLSQKYAENYLSI